MGDFRVDAAKLPRLLVVSDVGVERFAGGSLVMYRLFNGYPPGKLMVFTPQTGDAVHERVVGAEYRDLSYGIPRWIWNRFNPFWPVLMAASIRSLAPKVVKAAQEFRPQAVLSVAHGFLWFTADRVAAELNIPHHLCLHDDWPAQCTLSQSKWVKPAVRAACRRVSRPLLCRARVRYCISPGMAELYLQQFGVNSIVLYPPRGQDSAAPTVRTHAPPTNPFVVVYAGLIHKSWAAASLRNLALQLAVVGGRLDLYVPYDDAELMNWGLTAPNVRRVGFFPAHEMAKRVRQEAHALILPAAFDPDEQLDISTLFPSKLADYTSIGLPILVWGPGYSSACRWAADNPGATELVTEVDPRALLPALRRLADSQHALRVASTGVAAGIRNFDADTVRDQFWRTLSEERM